MAAMSRRAAVLRELAVAAILVGTLASCASQPFPIYDVRQEESDVLPSEVLDGSPDLVLDGASSRWVGEYSGVTFYLVRAEGRHGDPDQCLAVVYDDTWLVSCSSGLPLEVSLPNGVTAQLVSAPAVETEQWLPVSDYVRVEK